MKSYQQKYYKYKAKYHNLKWQYQQSGGNLTFTLTVNPPVRTIFTKLADEDQINEFKEFNMEHRDITKALLSRMIKGLPIDQVVIDKSMIAMIHKYIPKYFSCFMNQQTDFGGKLYFGLSDDGYLLGIPTFDTDLNHLQNIVRQETMLAFQKIFIKPVNPALPAIENLFQFRVEIEELHPPHLDDMRISDLESGGTVATIIRKSLELPNLMAQYDYLKGCALNLEKAKLLFQDKLNEFGIYNYLNKSSNYNYILEAIQQQAPSQPLQSTSLQSQPQLQSVNQNDFICRGHSSQEFVIEIDLKLRLPMSHHLAGKSYYMILHGRNKTSVKFEILETGELVSKKYDEIRMHLIYQYNTWCMTFLQLDSIMEKYTINTRKTLVQKYKSADCPESKYETILMSYYGRFSHFYRYYLQKRTPIRFYMLVFTIIKNANYIAGRDYNVEFEEDGEMKRTIRHMKPGNDPECKSYLLT